MKKYITVKTKLLKDGFISWRKETIEELIERAIKENPEYEVFQAIDYSVSEGYGGFGGGFDRYLILKLKK